MPRKPTPLRKPRSLVLWDYNCHRKGESHKSLPYGTVWVQVLSQGAPPRRAIVANARAIIAKEIRRAGFTFARWVPVLSVRDPHLYNHSIWHIAADVVWDDAYEKAQCPVS